MNELLVITAALLGTIGVCVIKFNQKLQKVKVRNRK